MEVDMRGERSYHNASYQDRPCAAAGFISYRYAGRYGYVMIGGKDDADALREAGRSIDGEPVMEELQVWDATLNKYVNVT